MAFLRVTAVLLGLLLSFAVLAFGATQPWSVSALEMSIFALALAWTIRMLVAPYRLRLPWALAPLSTLPLWAAGQLLAGSAVYRQPTLAGLLIWSACVLLFAIGAQVFPEAPLREGFLRYTACFGFALSVLALLQYFTAEGKIFWFLKPRFGTPFGPFANPDHYAALIELLLPIALFFALTERRQTLFYSAAAGVMYASVVVCASRAGTALATLEIAGVLTLASWRGIIPARRLGFLTAQLLLLIAVFSAITGWGTLWFRLRQSDPFRYRRELAQSSLEMIRERPLAGFGIGNFETVYPRFARFDGFFIDHAHNDWLEWAVEGGIPLVLVILAAVISLVPAAVRSLWGIGVLSVFAHSLVDFPMRIPAIAAFTFALMAALAGTPRARREQRQRSAGGGSFGARTIGSLRGGQ